MAQASQIYGDRLDRSYISTAMKAPMLEREEEMNLGRDWRDNENEDALDQLITSHIRLVVKTASRFKGYGLPLADLIQEGNAGLLQAANRFDPEQNVRFSTYASWWILAAIQEYVIRNASIVRLGTTPAQKSLFFNLRRLRSKMKDALNGPMTNDQRKEIADALKVPLAAVERMEAHLSGPDRSLNATIGLNDGEGDMLQDFLVYEGPGPDDIVTDRMNANSRTAWLNEAMESLNDREKKIIQQRFLSEDKVTLSDIGADFGVTKERIRQIESKALEKLKTALSAGHDHPEKMAKDLLDA